MMVLYATVVGSILDLIFSRSGSEAKRGVEFRQSTRNASRIRILGTEDTGGVKREPPLSFPPPLRFLCLCYIQDIKFSKKIAFFVLCRT